MARARNIKPSFFTNEELAELPFSTRLLFIGLWTIADREGRLEDRPKRIKMALMPGDDVNVDKALEELRQAGFIDRYTVAEQRLIQVVNFTKHQNPHHKEAPSTLPANPKSPGFAAHASPPKPEALTPCMDEKGKENGASKGGQTVLIPDSLNLIPDSLRSSSAPGLTTVAPATPESAAPPAGAEVRELPKPDRATLIAIYLRKQGIAIQAAHPLAQQWQAQGVTDDHLAEAVAIARMRKPTGPIAPGYLAPILAEAMEPRRDATGKTLSQLLAERDAEEAAEAARQAATGAAHASH